MRLILLPGNSKLNKEWIEKLAVNLKEIFDKTYIHYYKHWETGEEIINIDYELERLADYLAKKKGYIIIAKSIGAALAVKGIKEGKIAPKKCIFLGLPVIWCRQYSINLDSWIKGYSARTLFIQNTEDPVMGADELKDFLNKNNVSNYKFVKLEGTSHNYEDLDKIKILIKEFIKK